jgi:hypothetical protein
VSGGDADRTAALNWVERALVRVVLIEPSRVSAQLARAEAVGLVAHAPNVFQLTLGVLRMWHRLMFRPDSVGTSSTARIRSTRRARRFAYRPLRLPSLLVERAVAPLDHSGLKSSKERILRHLCAAHHDRRQFAYDLELLRLHPGALDELVERARAIVEGEHPRAALLRDLCVYEGYHESLLDHAERARAGEALLDAAEICDPDISFGAYLRWCAVQPESLAAALAEPRFSLSSDPERARSVVLRGALA